MSRWYMPGNFSKFNGVQYYYEDPPYRIEIFERIIEDSPWQTQITIDGEYLTSGYFEKLYMAKYKTIEFINEHRSKNENA